VKISSRAISYSASNFLILKRFDRHNKAKKSFYRGANAIFGKIGRLASEEAVLHICEDELDYLDVVINCKK